MWEKRKAIKSHNTPTSTGSWDGPGNVSKLKSDQDKAFYSRMFAWNDPDKDPTTKSAYKLPHHDVDSDGNPGSANIKGCQSVIGVLNGSMGGVDIPDEDRQGVYNHVARHLEDADVEPAELRDSNNMNKEKRVLKVQLEVRSLEEGKKKLVGMPIVYNRNSEDLGWFTESIAEGAATEALKKSDIRLLYGHNDSSILPLARTSAGTMTFRETKNGVEIEADPPDIQFARDLMVSIDRGDVQDMSFGFTVSDDEWSKRDGKDHRTILKFREIFDFSYVAFPAYPDTSAATRSLEQHNLRNKPEFDIEAENENIEIELLSLRAGR